MTKRRVTWRGSPPRCDIEESHNIGDSFVDGKTRMGPWACMCLACHKGLGVGLGLGLGQRYERTADGREVVWLKVEG